MYYIAILIVSCFLGQDGMLKVWKAIRCGNRKMAGYFVTKAIERDGFGFNFLHKEVCYNSLFLFKDGFDIDGRYDI
jgi:hypothetical protein